MKILAELKVDDKFVDIEINHQDIVDFVYAKASTMVSHEYLLILKLTCTDNRCLTTVEPDTTGIQQARSESGAG